MRQMEVVRFDVKIVLLMNDSVVQPIGDAKIAVVV